MSKYIEKLALLVHIPDILGLETVFVVYNDGAMHKWAFLSGRFEPVLDKVLSTSLEKKYGTFPVNCSDHLDENSACFCSKQNAEILFTEIKKEHFRRTGQNITSSPPQKSLVNRIKTFTFKCFYYFVKKLYERTHFRQTIKAGYLQCEKLFLKLNISKKEAFIVLSIIELIECLGGPVLFLNLGFEHWSYLSIFCHTEPVSIPAYCFFFRPLVFFTYKFLKKRMEFSNQK